MYRSKLRIKVVRDSLHQPMLRALLAAGRARACRVGGRAPAPTPAPRFARTAAVCADDSGPARETPWSERYVAALQRSSAERTFRLLELSDQDYSAFSGVGVITCSVGGETRTSTAFLVGAFDLGVTVAHTFARDASGAEPDCVYNSVDSRGQMRERIPVAYIKSQWDAEADASGQAAKDFAVIRLSQPSRYAQRTMPLGRFSGTQVQACMVGYKSRLDADTVKRKARGTVYGRNENEATNLVGFSHDMDARDIAAGAPVIDEVSGVIIGIHTPLAARRNTMITMTDWLETTLREEMQVAEQAGAKVN